VSNSSKYLRYIWHTVEMAWDICVTIFTTVRHIYLVPFLLCVRCTCDIYYCVTHISRAISTVCQMYLWYLLLCDTSISCHFYCVSDVPEIFTTVWYTRCKVHGHIIETICDTLGTQYKRREVHGYIIETICDTLGTQNKRREIHEAHRRKDMRCIDTH
jgi:hypothetical protein